tara:strand:- start:181 stop:444 length:264 start_codon:yes stop_codon:yes gene_type:complete
MAKFIVYKDGCLQELTAAEYEEHFGVVPVAPATSGTHSGNSFGGRYSHNTFCTGSVADNGTLTQHGSYANSGIFDPGKEFISGSVKR